MSRLPYLAGYHLPPAELGFSITAYAPHDAAALARELRAELDLIARLLAPAPSEASAP